LLSKQGWFLLNDSQTVLLTSTSPGFATRPAHAGSYQDGYFFGYGHDYAQGLSDLRQLTGPAPMLPRKAFGVWFSRYWAYSDSEIHDLIGQFRANRVPLDTLSIDTDWKVMHNVAGCIVYDQITGARIGDPCSWNGWSWEQSLFPDPPGFLNWAHAEGLAIALNVHPSIDSTDPQYPQVLANTGGLATDQFVPPCLLLQADPAGQCYVFDWTQPKQLDAYFALHAPLETQGVDFWWLDWCCDGSSAIAQGLTADTWINSRYAADNAARGQRWPAFSRIGASLQSGQAGIGNNGAGAFAEHRYTMHFTGDTCATWEMLAFEAEFTAAEGSIGLPYVTHDIGSFLGPPTATGCNGTLGHTAHLPDDLYVRWIQLGTFQPLDRLHSNHGDRLPWQYTGVAQQAAADFLRLRERLVPYLYTLSRQSYDTGLPMVRALYLQWPDLDDAYKYPAEFTLGYDMLVATVTSPGDPAATTVWIPPGTWNDYFTGESFTGPATIVRSIPLGRYPVFVRAGAIIPTQLDLPTSSAAPQDGLALDAWAGTNGSFDLYEDEGQGFGYVSGADSWTPIASTQSQQGCMSMTIGAVTGQFPGSLSSRSWTVRFVGIPSPSVVTIGGQRTTAGQSYDAVTRTLTVQTGARATASPVTIVAGTNDCSQM
jgi:alpha-glucosidase (family GH31 glycosyl hydrolase)